MAKQHQLKNGLVQNCLARKVNNYGKSCMECRALLHNHNFDLWFDFAFEAFVYFTINREEYGNNRQICLEMLLALKVKSNTN